jgi:hypothetical protein
MKNKTRVTEVYEKDGVSVAEIEISGNFAAFYFLCGEAEGIILNSKLPEEAKPEAVDLLLEKRHTEALRPIDFLNTEETPNVKGLIYKRV